MLVPWLGRWLVNAMREGMTSLQVDDRFCVRVRHRRASCHRCVEGCPTGALDLNQGPRVDQERCTGCGISASVCPTGTLEMVAPTDPGLLGRMVEVARGNSSVAVACTGYFKRSGAPASGVVRVACLGRRFQPPTSPCFAPAGGPWGRFQADNRCTRCGMCAFFCPIGPLRMEARKGGGPPIFTHSLCTDCGLCQEICFQRAAYIASNVDLAQWWDG